MKSSQFQRTSQNDILTRSVTPKCIHTSMGKKTITNNKKQQKNKQNTHTHKNNNKKML